MAIKYTSDELFHFVGHSSPCDDEANYEILAKVIRGNCISHAPHDGTWGQVKYTTTWAEQLAVEKLIVPSITCYADIPFEALDTHVSKYGKFGLSLPTWLLTKYGARPVTYVPMRSDDWQSPNGLTLLRDIEAIVKGFHEQVVERLEQSESGERQLGQKPNSAEKAIHAVHNLLMKDFLAFVKPFNSELPHNHRDNYYMEREWRKYGNMVFEASQVSRIVVAKGFKSRVEAEFPEYINRVFEI